MAFDGNLLKVGTYTFPLDFIKADTFVIAPNQRQDLDSGVDADADGELIRQVLPHTRTKIEFNIPCLHYKQKQELMRNLKSQYLNYGERRVPVTYFDDENDEYKTGIFYMPDIQWQYKMVDKKNADILYNETRVAFIEY